MKVYDYNQEFGGNYYQPMIQYINHKASTDRFPRRLTFTYPTALRLPLPSTPTCVTTTSPPPTTASVMNTRMRHETHNTDLHPTPTSKLIRDHYIKLVKNLALRDEVDLPPLL